MNGTPYHKSCFKCTHGGCVISPSNYIAHEGKLYCKHHHVQLIKEKGNLSQLEGDHEKSAEQEKINGEVVAAETWNEMKWNAWVITDEYSLPQVPYFCIMCLCYLSCFANMESIMLLKNMVLPFFVVGVCANPSFCFLLLWSCGF